MENDAGGLALLGLGPGEFLLWVQVLLLWAAANYATFNDPSGIQDIEALRRESRLNAWKRKIWVRAGMLALATLPLAGPHAEYAGARGILAMLALAAGAMLPLVRARIATKGSGWLAEWEMGTNLGFALLSAILIDLAGLATTRPLLRIPLATDKLTFLIALVAFGLFMGRGGAYIVRGVLNKAGALPLSRAPAGQRDLAGAGSEHVDLKEFNRGRMIGILERLILAMFMVVEAYQAIGFLIAAKGLIRSKELENRDFAEYFLVGTLASTLIAIAVGVLVQHWLKTAW